MKIPNNTKIQSVELRVKNLDKSLNFYSHLIGLKEIYRKNNISFLTANGEYPYLVKLVEDKNAVVEPSRKASVRVIVGLGAEPVAAVVKLTGDCTVEPLTGEHTFTPADMGGLQTANAAGTASNARKGTAHSKCFFIGPS